MPSEKSINGVRRYWRRRRPIAERDQAKRLDHLPLMDRIEAAREWPPGIPLLDAETDEFLNRWGE